MNFYIDSVKPLILAEDWETAIATLTELDQDQLDCLSYGYLGLAYFLRGEEGKAQEVWSDLLFAFDNGGEILVRLIGEEAHTCLQRRQFRVAQSLWEIVLDLETSPAALIGLADSLAQQALFEEAMEAWDAALNLDSSLVEVYHQKGLVWQALKEYEKAIAVYQQLLVIAPGDGEGLYQLGLCLQAVGQGQKALDCLLSGLGLSEEPGKILGEVGMIFWRGGYPEEAFSYLRRMAHQQRQAFERLLVGFEQIISVQSKTGQDGLLLRYGLLKALLVDGEETDFCQQLMALNGLGEPVPAIVHSEVGAKLTGFYLTTREWADQGLGKFWPVFPESLISLKPPQTRDPAIHCSFRFGEGVPLPASFVVLVPQGRVWLNRGESRMAVITPDNRLLGDLSPESPALSPNHPDKHPSRHSLLQGGQLPPFRAVPGTVAVLSGLLNDVYFHWLFDVLPRFHLLQLAGWRWEDIDGFVVNHQLPFQGESLARLGVPSSKVIHHAGQADCHLQADHLLVPSFPGTVAWMPQWVCGFLRDLFLDVNAVQGKPKHRLYIRRHLSSSRRLINEEEVIACLENWGFQAISLELLSVREQACLFANAEMVVAPHGSGLSNLVFCPPETKVIEIFSPFYVYPCFWLVSNLMGLTYFYVLGDIVGGKHFHHLVCGDDREGDIIVNFGQLLDVLRWAILS